MGESTARGSGRNASGPLVATWQMLEWIRDNGPADRATIVEHCSRFVDVGYARRWYAERLANSRIQARDKSRLMGQQARSAEPVILAEIPATHAQARVIIRLLGTSVRGGTLRLTDGKYHWKRMPERTPAGFAVEAVTSDERTNRRHVYERELVIQLRAANKRGAFTTGRATPRITGKERTALFRWLSTFDDLDDEKIQVTGVELEAIVTLRAMRARQSDMTRPQETTAEKATIRALWLALDNFAQ